MLALGAALVDTDFVLAVDCDAAALVVAQENAVDMELDDRIHFVQARVVHHNDSAAVPSKQQHHRGGRRGPKSKPTPVQSAARKISILSDDDGISLKSKCVDTVLTNPPFGTKHNAGMDLRFLRTATRLARRAVYSFHKTTTRDFMIAQVTSWGYEVQVVAEMKFDLPNVYKFHTKKSVDIEVDLIRVRLVSSDNMTLIREPHPSEQQDEDEEDDHEEDELEYR
jgi:predicted RNA methylase